MSNHAVLPPNATDLQRALIDAITPDLPVTIRDLWYPQTCPAEFLPYLAQSFSVDRWDINWSEQEKRSVIDAAFFVHKHKGTVASIRQVVEPLGYLINVTEWWQTTPKGTPHTFQLVIGVQEHGITDAMYNQMVDLIDDAKPLRSHMTGLDIYAEVVGAVYVGAACYTGDTTTVYPFSPELVSVTGYLSAANFEHTIDSVRVYPL